MWCARDVDPHSAIDGRDPRLDHRHVSTFLSVAEVRYMHARGPSGRDGGYRRALMPMVAVFADTVPAGGDAVPHDNQRRSTSARPRPGR